MTPKKRQELLSVFNYAQVEFLLAEAAVRGLIAGDPAAHYEAGIRAHMESLSRLPTGPSVTEQEIVNYIQANPLDDPGDPADDSDEAKINKIATEFWVSAFCLTQMRHGITGKGQAILI